MQHKKGFLALAIVLIIGLRVFGRREAPEEGNRIRNGQFSEVNGSMPEDWETGMWVTSPGTTFFEVVTLEDGTKAALIENGSWAPMAAKGMKDLLSSAKGIEFCGTTVTVKGSMTDDTVAQLGKLADEILG